MGLRTFLHHLLHGRDDAAAPEEGAPSPAADPGAGEAQREHLRFQQRFGAMFRDQPGARGHVFLLDLSPVHRTLGDRWPNVRDTIHRATETTLNERLAPDDLFTRYDEESFLVVYGRLADVEARVKTWVLARAITDALLGSRAPATPVLAAHQVTAEADGGVALTPVPPPSEDMLTRVTGADAEPDTAPATRIGTGPAEDEPPREALAGLDIRFLFRPLLTARTMVLSAYLCLPVLAVGPNTFRGGHEIPDTRQGIVELDRMTLARAAETARVLARSGTRALLCIPVHLETLSTQERKNAYFHLCEDLLPGAEGYAPLFELVGLPEGIPEARLAEAAAPVRRFARQLLARTGLTPHGPLGRFREAGFHAVGADVYRSQHDEATLFRETERFAEAASRAGIRTYLHGIRSLSLYSQAIAAGFDYVDGHALTSVLPNPESAQRFQLDDPYRALLGGGHPGSTEPAP